MASNKGNLSEKGGKMSKWLNNKKRIWTPDEIEKPCHKCDFCPYGQLVEEFPCHPEFGGQDLNSIDLETGFNCHIFGHDCPVFYHAENLSEEE